MSKGWMEKSKDENAKGQQWPWEGVLLLSEPQPAHRSVLLPAFILFCIHSTINKTFSFYLDKRKKINKH